jgi:hypothetical protein
MCNEMGKELWVKEEEKLLGALTSSIGKWKLGELGIWGWMRMRKWMRKM